MAALKTARRVAKASRPWEWAYIVALIVLVVATVVPSALGLPLLVRGVLLLPMVGMVAGLFFVIDNMRSRVG